jgi:hypothetical protein
MQGMEGTSSVDNATSAEDICKGEAPVADLFFMPEGTGPQRDNAESVSKGEVAVVAPEGAGPQLEGDDAPLKAGSIPSLLSTSAGAEGEDGAGGTSGAPGLASRRTPELLAPVPAEASADGASLLY